MRPVYRQSAEEEPVEHHADRLADRDSGSVAPLVIGMLVCLLVLTAGVIAAGSSFLADMRLQRLCDGAAAAAAGAVSQGAYSGGGAGTALPLGREAVAAANSYLLVRGRDVSATVDAGAGTITASCRTTTTVAFGFLFGAATLDKTTTSTARPIA